MKKTKGNRQGITATGYAERTAVDTKNGMTLDELGALVDAARAQRIDGYTIVNIISTWRSSIKAIKVEGPVMADMDGYHQLTGDGL